MDWLPIILADDPQGAPPQGGPPGPFGNIMFPVMIAFAVFMIFTLRSKSRENKEMQNLLSKVKKNDKVITRAGIIGVVVAVKETEDEVTLRVDDTTNSRIRVQKSSIVTVVTEEQQQAAQTTENKT
jgi:preprotein translocase subunit YajC